MPPWKFDGISLHSPTHKWPARSGGFADALPHGEYTIGVATAIADTAKNINFKDKANNVWWCPLTPAPGLTARTGFGIHPDGGPDGTHGCIGLTDFNTIETYRQLCNALGQKLQVCG
ncbi:MAG: hypothetical protein LBQ10_09635 [Desulfovibrio sp.]|jgi:hypothetical protein|nr:hypothetical protein [Desulfovibrio sp.]